MSFLNDFEDRIGSVFDMAPQGYTEPFSFKKLAKRAAKEMEHETYEIDGVDTAPALFTVLVSSADDSLMRPLYKQITDETKRNTLLQDAQKIEYDTGGYIIWGFKRQLDAYSNLVTGFEPHRYMPCDAFGFKHVAFVE